MTSSNKTIKRKRSNSRVYPLTKKNTKKLAKRIVNCERICASSMSYGKDEVEKTRDNKAMNKIIDQRAKILIRCAKCKTRLNV